MARIADISKAITNFQTQININERYVKWPEMMINQLTLKLRSIMILMAEMPINIPSVDQIIFELKDNNDKTHLLLCSIFLSSVFRFCFSFCLAGVFCFEIYLMVFFIFQSHLFTHDPFNGVSLFLYHSDVHLPIIFVFHQLINF